jgi:hypothetical protein
VVLAVTLLQRVLLALVLVVPSASAAGLTALQDPTGDRSPPSGAVVAPEVDLVDVRYGYDADRFEVAFAVLDASHASRPGERRAFALTFATDLFAWGSVYVSEDADGTIVGNFHGERENGSVVNLPLQASRVGNAYHVAAPAAAVGDVARHVIASSLLVIHGDAPEKEQARLGDRAPDEGEAPEVSAFPTRAAVPHPGIAALVAGVVLAARSRPRACFVIELPPHGP